MMKNLEIPKVDLLDEAVAVEDNLERAASFFCPTPFLTSSIPGLLMWRDRYAFALARRGRPRFVLSLAPGETYVPLPPNPFNSESVSSVFEYLAAVNGQGPGLSRMEGLTREQAQLAESWGWAARPLSEDFIYDRARTGALSGDPYRDRRNEINRLVRNHALLSRPYRPSDLGACGKLYEKWKTARRAKLDSVGERMLEHSQKAHLRTLTQLDAWGLEAHLLFVDGQMGAYTVTGPLDGDTLGVHMEVADLTLPGTGTYSFVQNCRLHPGVAWVNAGDAEFLPGLRAAKESWHPARKIMRWAIEPKSTQ